MRGRKLMSVLGALALLVGVAVAARPLVLHAADVRGTGKGEGKVGDQCTTTSDCEQKPRPLTCREVNGESRCYAPPIRPVT